MRKTLLAMLTLTTALTVPASALAQDLDDDMNTLAENYEIVLKTHDTGEMKTALNTMKQAAQDSRTHTPPRLEGKAPNGPEMTDYRHGLDILIGQIDGALALLNQGRLKEAQVAAEKFKNTRNIYHKKYQ